jgi:hypothetical protein
MIVQEIKAELLDRMETNLMGNTNTDFEKLGKSVMNTLNQILKDNMHIMRSSREKIEVGRLIYSVTNELYDRSN